MINRIISICLHKRLVAIVVAILLVVFGYYSWTKMSVLADAGRSIAPRPRKERDMNCSTPIEGDDRRFADYTYHPACVLFPKFGKDELQELAADIKANGLRNPIVMLNGDILDGRNRLLACEVAGVEPRFVEWDGTGSPVEWVVSENLVRRHLTSSQRAVIAHDLLPLLEAEAKERQRDGGSLAKKLAKRETNGKASQAAARMTGTNSTYVEVVKSIRQKAPELIEQVRSGNITVPDAKKLAKLPDEQRQEVLGRCNGHPLGSGEFHDILNEVRKEQREKAARRLRQTGHGRRRHPRRRPGDSPGSTYGRIGGHLATDPPYGQVALYERLAELAAAKLKPGGLCLAYAGQFYLPEVM